MTLEFIKPGKPMQNGFIERFNRSNSKPSNRDRIGFPDEVEKLKKIGFETFWTSELVVKVRQGCGGGRGRSRS